MKLIKNNQEAYMGWHDGHPIWDGKTPDYSKIYFHVKNTSTTPGLEKLVMISRWADTEKWGTAPDFTLYYSKDGNIWNSVVVTDENFDYVPDTIKYLTLPITLLPGEILYLKAETPYWGGQGSDSYVNVNGIFVHDHDLHVGTDHSWIMAGNIMSLLYGDAFVGKTTFPQPNTKSIFEHFMLGGFVGPEYCTSIENVILPATTLLPRCYSNMFTRIGAEKAPELPAPVLVSQCYDYMFQNCHNLKYIKCLATTGTSINAYGWLTRGASTGTFVKKAGVSWPTGASGIPSGWTIIEV